MATKARSFVVARSSFEKVTLSCVFQPIVEGISG